MPDGVAWIVRGMLLAGALGAGSYLQAAEARPSSAAWENAPVRGQAVVAEPLDLNTATAAELRALPGMGEVYVRRILEARPFTAKNQLLTRGILPQAAYEAIRDHVVAHRPPRMP